MRHIVGNFLTRATTLFHTSSQLKVYTQNYAPPKSRESQLWEFQDSHLGVLGQNVIWVLVPWPSIEYTIRGKVVASPKSKSWWILWIRVCLWWVYASKCYNYALTNLICASLCEWLNSLSIFLIPSRSSNTPSTPKVLRTTERAPTPSPSNVFTFGLAIKSVKELGGASHSHNTHWHVII
jgi:hypothetical protein